MPTANSWPKPGLSSLKTVADNGRESEGRERLLPEEPRDTGESSTEAGIPQ